MQERTPKHDLPSFTRYLKRVFQFRRLLGKLRDARQDPDISPHIVLLADAGLP